MVVNVAQVIPYSFEARNTGNRYLIEKVCGLLGVVVQRQLDAVLQEGKVNGDVCTLGLLPSEVSIAERVGVVTTQATVCGIGQCRISSCVADVVVTCFTIAQAELQGVPPLEVPVLEELFIRYQPSGRSCREYTPLVV